MTAFFFEERGRQGKDRINVVYFFHIVNYFARIRLDKTGTLFLFPLKPEIHIFIT